MNHRTNRLWIVWSLAGLFGLTNAMALPPEGRPRGPASAGYEGWDSPARLFDELGLTEEQKEQLREHRQSHRKMAAALRQELKEKREALRQELEKSDVNPAAAKKINADLKILQSTMADHRLEGILAVRTILTKEQHEQFVKLRQERMQQARSKRRSSRGEGFGPRGKDGQGPGYQKGPRGTDNRGPGDPDRKPAPEE